MSVQKSTKPNKTYLHDQVKDVGKTSKSMLLATEPSRGANLASEARCHGIVIGGVVSDSSQELYGLISYGLFDNGNKTLTRLWML